MLASSDGLRAACPHSFFFEYWRPDAIVSDVVNAHQHCHLLTRNDLHKEMGYPLKDGLPPAISLRSSASARPPTHSFIEIVETIPRTCEMARSAWAVSKNSVCWLHSAA